MRITYICPSLKDARSRARVDWLRAAGAEVSVYGFDRVGYYGSRQDRCDANELGVLSHGNLTERAGPYLAAVPILRSAIARSDVVYCLGLDVAVLGWLSLLTTLRQKILVLEIQDIRHHLLESGLKSRILRAIDRLISQRCDMLVVTSDAYITEYYESLLGARVKNWFLLENKAISRGELIESVCDSRAHNSLTIGYFGLLRCPYTIDAILRAAEYSGGRIRFYLRGIFLKDTEDLRNKIDASPYINFDGEYRSPDDLSMMFSKIDMLWACYPADVAPVGNWRWARTNRFYEGCFFRKPMIALEGSYDGRVVKEFRIGCTVNLRDVEECVARLMSIGTSDIEFWSANLSRLPNSMYVETGEHGDLVHTLSRLAKT